jgi:hypothetical protein
VNAVFKNLECDLVVDLPERLETATWFSPITTTVTQSALALNAVNLGGSQTALAANGSIVAVATS